ncbi:putative chaperone protein [Cercophora scortea]|uniref:Chaperone protein n=1 Tax=Cercophora scortea TaxID=314031 RepID=A0AAE0I2L4_9PEZI|nr:putative chaperone protein [Cercophora scortea]
MATTPLDSHTLGLVFEGRPDILAGIQKAADSPARVTLFNNIASFVQQRLANPTDEPASKRRRVDVAATIHANGDHSAAQTDEADADAAAAAEEVLLEIKDISVVVPQRKKYDLCFTKNFLYARASGTSAPVQGIIYPLRDIEHAFYLPVPDKSQAQFNYVLFPRDSYLPTTKAQQQQSSSSSTLEPLVFTVPATTAPKPDSISGPLARAAEAVADAYSSLFNWALTTSLRTAHNKTCTQIVSADAKLFHSAARQAYRPSEKAVHVKAFRGSKDGFLFFLPTGILWGFKKPLLFLPLDRIVAVSYTSVLQRTFNIVVEFEGRGEGGEGEEIEFAMLDQEDYQGIDEMYIRRHGLADRSMAEQRKAKRQLVENKGKEKEVGGGEGEEGAGEGGEGDDGMTELERANAEAEKLLQDEEDELEEDYDPDASGDDSGGSGSSGSDDDDDDDDVDDDDDDVDDDDDEDGDEDEDMEDEG